MLKLIPLFLAIASAAQAHLSFEENRGQTDRQAHFLLRTAGQTYFFTPGATLVELAGANGLSSVVRISFPGSRSGAEFTGEGVQPGGISYYVGNDPSKWVKDAPRYGRVTRRAIYPGVDITYYGDAQGRLEYDLTLRPGADAASIRLRFEGAEKVRQTSGGEIEIVTKAGSLWQRAPVVYQEIDGQRVPVKGWFEAVDSGEFRLSLASYRHDLPLVVDPVLDYAAYAGGEADDQIVVAHPRFVAGNTRSIVFPETLRQRRRTRDVFIRDMEIVSLADGSRGPINATTIIGGSDDDELTCAAEIVDFSTLAPLRLTAGGVTRSRDWPFAPGSTFGGGETDGFVIRSQSPPVPGPFAASYLGGTGDDRINSLITARGNSFVYATGSTNSSGLSLGAAIQTEPVGGRDAFLALISSSGSLVQFSYFGGEGDDEGTSIVLDAQNRVFVAGVTGSANFPAAGPARGGTDGFISRIERFGFVATTPEIAWTQRIGGSGDDRVSQIALPTAAVRAADPVGDFLSGTGDPPQIAVAGTTTSRDLPVREATQAQLAGSSDALIARLRSDGEVIYLSYWGGNGDDSAAGIRIEPTLDLYAAGSTTSTDLKTVDALQSANAGRSDGWALALDSSNTPRQATYFGGSGDDRVLGLALDTQSIRLVGETSSDDLPVVTPGSQFRRGGGTDGFVADLRITHLRLPATVQLGKDLEQLVWTGDPSLVTFESSDTSRVRVVRSASGWSAEALADSGQVTLRARSAALGTRDIAVQLYPSVLAVGRFPVAGTPIRLNFATGTWPLQYSLAAVDPATNRLLSLGTRRSSLPTLNVTWSVADPSVASVRLARSEFLDFPLPELVFRRPGQTDLRVSNDGGFPNWPADSVTLSIEWPRGTAVPMVLGKDLRRPITFSLVNPASGLLSNPTGDFTFRSEDPSKLLVSGDFRAEGQAEVSVRLQGGASPVVLHALADSGEAGIIVSSPQMAEDLRIPVRLEPTEIRRQVAGTQPNPVSVGLSGFSELFTPVPRSLPAGSGGWGLRPGAQPLDLEVISSDPAVLEVAEGFDRVRLLPGSQAVALGARLTGRTEGDAEVTFRAVHPDIRFEERVRYRVTAGTGAGGRISGPESVDLGLNLQEEIRFSQNNIDAQEATVTVSDPSLALLAATSQAASVPQLSLRASSSFSVWVRGVAERGVVRVRVELNPSGAAFEVPVTLLRSGFAIFAPQVVELNGRGGAVFVGAAPLDSETGVPLAFQQLRPGLTPVVRFRQEGDSIQVSANTWNTAAPVSTGLPITPRAVGTTVLELETPEGFSPAALLNRARVDVRATRLNSTGFSIEKERVAAFLPARAGGRTGNIVVTSSDPARLLVSTAPTATGSASVTVVNGQLVYAHALAGDGVVLLRSTGEGMTPGEAQVRLLPLRLNIGAIPAIPVGQGGVIQVFMTPGSFGLRPGAVPPEFSVVSSDPSVLEVRTAQIRFPPNQTSALFELRGLKAGEAELRFSSPPGAITDTERQRVRVAAPELVLISAQIAKDLRSVMSVTSRVRPSENVNLTVTSLAPDRLLVSLPDGTPAASVTVPWPAGAQASFEGHALAGDGDVPVRLSAPGYADATAAVTLTPLSLTLVARTTGFVQLGERIRAQAALSAPGGEGRPLSFRDGVAPIDFTVSSSDPGVLSVTPDRGTLRPGTGFASPELVLEAREPGNATVDLSVPPSLADPGVPRRRLGYTVRRGQLELTCDRLPTLSPLVIGNQTAVNCVPNVSGETQRTITARSSDGALAGVAFGPFGVPAVAATGTYPGFGSVQFRLFGLAAAGSAEIEVTVPGYDSARVAVNLDRTYYDFSSRAPITIRAGATVSLGVVFRRATRSGNVSPLGSVALPLTLSTPGVVSEPGSVILGPAGTGLLSLTGVAPGTTLLNLTAPAGFEPPVTDPIRITVVP